MDAKAQGGFLQMVLALWIYKVQLPALLQRPKVFFEKGSLFPGIGLCGPLPMGGIGPEPGIFKGGFIAASVPVPLYAAPTVIEMQMGQEDIGDIVPVEAHCPQGAVQAVVPPEMVIGEELFGLFVAQTVVDRKSTRLNSSHVKTSYAVFCLKK